MKNPEINIIRKISPEQKKLLFFAPLAIVVLVICGYVLFSGDSKPESKSANNNNEKAWELPSDSKKEIPNSTIAVIDELDKHNNKNKSNKDFFKDLENTKSNDNSEPLKEELNTKDEMYKSIQKQLQDLEKQKGKKTNISRRKDRPKTSQQNTVSNQSIVIEDDNNIDVNDFFNKKTKVSEKASENTISDNLKTDKEIYAVIHNDQSIQTNERLKLRLTKEATINGIIFDKNTFIYGFTKFGKNRVNLTINNINNVPVKLTAYDKQDGNIGIYVKGANLSGDLSKESTDGSIDEIDVNGVPLGNTIKNVFKKKAKETKVHLLNNYEIVLKSNI